MKKLALFFMDILALYNYEQSQKGSQSLTVCSCRHADWQIESWYFTLKYKAETELR